MKTLPEKFTEFIAEQDLFQPKDKLLLAVSGGVDSVVLCELCYQSGFDFIIAHCNFQLRGEENERDENFVRGLAQKYDKEILVKKFDTKDYADEHKVSIQVAARELRYNWFKEIVDSWQLTDDRHPTINYQPLAINYILIAHHLNDNIETLLMNFFKGTGITGLHGILSKQRKIIRPLLFAKKEELKKFAEENDLKWVEDSSNESDKYSRNYLRHNIIPALTEIYPNLTDNLANNIDRFKEIEILYHQSIGQHKKDLLEKKGNEIHIPVLKLKKTVPLSTIVYEIIKDYNFSPQQVDEVVNLLDSESGKYIQSSTHRIIKNRKWIIIAPNDSSEAENIIIEGVGRWPLVAGELQIEKFPITNFKLQTENNIASVDADKISFPLLLRKWKQGDYFYPLGMRKKKKLARFFIDNKLSKTDKEKIWVLESTKKIAWIVGMRIDDRFKITPQTKNILNIEMRMH
ncbi:MAG TPA: tRNA lysidine(34) synthetase TilS [Puia sp.]|jgi:tRNA(Ile)-lysidine synthase|nr:tRNA lysidine(34) synthetase TilS [Puia sp.]